MAYSPTTWVDNAAPDISAANLNKLEQGLQAAALIADQANPAPVSTPPGSPVDGQICRYQVTAGPTGTVIWTLRYVAALGHWDFVGGSPLVLETITDEGIPVDSSVVDASGPSISGLRAGRYEIIISAQGIVANGSGRGFVVLYNNGADAGRFISFSNTNWGSASAVAVTDLSVNAAVLRLRYWAQAAAVSFNVAFRSMRIQPVFINP